MKTPTLDELNTAADLLDDLFVRWPDYAAWINRTSPQPAETVKAYVLQIARAPLPQAATVVGDWIDAGRRPSYETLITTLTDEARQKADAEAAWLATLKRRTEYHEARARRRLNAPGVGDPAK